jgi:diguanylate cyclase (GGDEF)-like protein
MMLWLIIAAATLPLRWTARGVVLGLGVTAAILIAATAGVSPAGLVHNPTLLLMTLTVLVCVSAFSVILMGAEREHRSESILDPLTGLLNRRTLPARLQELSQQAERTQQPICVIACDIDEFKLINDVYGHERGDAVLRGTAEAITGVLRSFELVYRLGGDEIVLVLPGTNLREGIEVAGRLRAATESQRPADLDVTLSIGVAAACGADLNCDALLARADEALYEAKRGGRNQVCAPRLSYVQPSMPRVSAPEIAA